MTFQPRIVVDGHFRGWVNPDLVAQFSLPANEAEKADRKGLFHFCTLNSPHSNSFGVVNKGSQTSGGARGWSAAKSRSAALFQKNPNTYFYRHKEPGAQQNLGEWTEAEYQRFIEIAEKFGCGDRWGLFSSHIPGRVGYQCANYYRGYVLPRGEIVDPNYKFTLTGEVIYSPSLKSSTSDETEPDQSTSDTNTSSTTTVTFEWIALLVWFVSLLLCLFFFFWFNSSFICIRRKEIWYYDSLVGSPTESHACSHVIA